ncbi:hypothetical protein D3C77_38060 [compost metagenome]
MVDINWDEAPEGTTHIVHPEAVRRNPWRKVDVANDKVYAWHPKEQGGLEGEWVDRRVESVDNYLRINKELLTERPVVVEAELPKGLQWPEGATHYYPGAETFFDRESSRYKFSRGGGWTNIPGELVQEYIGRKETIARYPEARPKAPVEELIKKKPVGWWS